MPFKADGTFEPDDASVSGRLNKVLASDSPLLTKARTRGAQVANRRGLLNSSLGVQAGEAAALDVALPIASQEAAQVHESNVQGGDIASREKISEAGIAAQERIAASNVASFEREKATAALAQFDANYQSAFQSIGSNENLPQATRERYLSHIGAIRDTNFNLIEQLYNVNLVWARTGI